MRSVKQINMKNWTYYFFDDMIDIKNFHSNLLNIYKISFKETDAVIYKIRYIKIKSLDYANIDNENPLFLISNTFKKLMEINP